MSCWALNTAETPSRRDVGMSTLGGCKTDECDDRENGRVIDRFFPRDVMVRESSLPSRPRDLSNGDIRNRYMRIYVADYILEDYACKSFSGTFS